MKHVGIIAEYNPFHNGHAYQIEKIREDFPEKKILVIMSGDFVQRGEPAIFNKYIRTECALISGADLLFELPPLFASASAEHFASASVLALAATGVTDTLCFGAEHDDKDSLWRIANLLVEEPPKYQILLKKYLKNGISFPKARSFAVSEYLQDPSSEIIIAQPNNILGIEYMKAIIKYNLNIQPYIIKRQGSGYHSLSLQHSFCSASALRKKIQDRCLEAGLQTAILSGHILKQQDILSPDMENYMPTSVYKLLGQSSYTKPLFLSSFYPFLQYALWEDTASYEPYFEVTKEIANHLSKILYYPPDIEDFLKELSSKNYTKPRIRRLLLNILLRHTKEDMQYAIHTGYIPYLRLLGFRFEAAQVLKEMKQTCTVPVINKVADAGKILSETDRKRFEKDIRISTLYQQAFFNQYGISAPSEYEHSVIIYK